MKESGNSMLSDSFKRSVPNMGGTSDDAPSSERSLREALAKTERTLAESQELALIGSWEWDIATGRLAWTAQTFSNFGEDPDSFIPTFENYTERLHPDDREMMMQTVQGAILSGKRTMSNLDSLCPWKSIQQHMRLRVREATNS